MRACERLVLQRSLWLGPRGGWWSRHCPGGKEGGLGACGSTLPQAGEPRPPASVQLGDGAGPQAPAHTPSCDSNAFIVPEPLRDLPPPPPLKAPACFVFQAGCRGNWTWTCQLPAPWPGWGASRLLLLPPGCTVRRRGGLQASQPPASAGQRCLPPGASRPGLRSLSAAPSPGLCQRGDDKGSFSRFLHLLRAAGCPPSLACPATMEPPVPCALPGPGGRPALQQGLGCMTPAPTFTACTWA